MLHEHKNILYVLCISVVLPNKQIFEYCAKSESKSNYTHTLQYLPPSAIPAVVYQEERKIQ